MSKGLRSVLVAVAVFVGACGGAAEEPGAGPGPEPVDACGCLAGEVCDSLLLVCHAPCTPLDPGAFDPEPCEALEGEGLCVQRPGAPGWICATDYTIS